MEDPETFFNKIFLKYFKDSCRYTKKSNLVVAIKVENCL